VACFSWHGVYTLHVEQNICEINIEFISDNIVRLSFCFVEWMKFVVIC